MTLPNDLGIGPLDHIGVAVKSIADALPFWASGLQFEAHEPEELESLFVQRVNARDLDGLLELYERTAVIAPGGGRMVRGQIEIRGFFEEYLARGQELLPSLRTEAIIVGNLALTSSWDEHREVTAEVARRQSDGSWRWVIDHFRIAECRD